MPTIYKPQKRKPVNTTKEKKRRQIYNSTLWQKTRRAYQMDHPLCEVCLLEGITSLAEHCHHLISFLDVPDELMQYYAYSTDNYCSVCAECHNRLHNGDLKGCKNKEDIERYLNAHQKNK